MGFLEGDYDIPGPKNQVDPIPSGEEDNGMSAADYNTIRDALNDIRSGVGGGAAASGFLGDGSDGALDFDGMTTILGIAPSGNVYTLTRSIFASSIIVRSGVTVRARRVFCTGTITGPGTISAAGFPGATGNASTIIGIGTGGTGGTGGGTSETFTGLAGANGGDGGNGVSFGGPTSNFAPYGFDTATVSSTNGNGNNGGIGQGGAGGGNTTGTGSAAGTITLMSAASGYASLSNFLNAINGRSHDGTQFSGGGGGGGGRGGRTAGSGGGGGGGGGGGCLIVVAGAFAGGIVLSVAGGNGGAAAPTGYIDAETGGGGGGGGGCLICATGDGSLPTRTISGGTGGAGTFGGGNGGNGGDGKQYVFNLGA